MASWNSKRTCTRTLGETAGGHDFHKYPPKTECGCLHGGVVGNETVSHAILSAYAVYVYVYGCGCTYRVTLGVFSWGTLRTCLFYRA